MENSLPNIEVKFSGGFQASIGSVACSMADLVEAINQFEKDFRGPILAFCTRIEFTIDNLNELMFFYLLEINWNQDSRQIFSELLAKKYLTLNQKINLCLDLLEKADFKIHKNKKNSTDGVKLMKQKLEAFRKLRNIFAHLQTKPYVNSKSKKIDVYLEAGKIKLKITKKYIEDALNNLHQISSVLSSYQKNFNLPQK